MTLTRSLALEVGVRPACEALGTARACYYRWSMAATLALRPTEPYLPPWSLSNEQRQEVLDVLHADRFIDRSPWAIYAALLDEGIYLCSVRTMYRILQKEGEVRERRNQLRHPVYPKPELLATGPNQVWSWDITKLKGPVKWTYYHLYVVLDIFSRYAVGWMLASRECNTLAQKLIEQSCEKQSVGPDQLIVHADRGPSMSSKPVALLLADLGVTKSHSRPHVSNDNPFSEAQFKTLKYRPDFPERFGSLEDARSFCQRFFSWYNSEHYHSGIGYLIPQQVQFGLSDQIVKEREAVLKKAYQKYPGRFKQGIPKPLPVPEAAWINKPPPKGDSCTLNS